MNKRILKAGNPYLLIVTNEEIKPVITSREYRDQYDPKVDYDKDKVYPAKCVVMNVAFLIKRDDGRYDELVLQAHALKELLTEVQEIENVAHTMTEEEVYERYIG